MARLVQLCPVMTQNRVQRRVGDVVCWFCCCCFVGAWFVGDVAGIGVLVVVATSVVTVFVGFAAVGFSNSSDPVVTAAADNAAGEFE